MKIISLFAGCGGLDLGFERAGFNVIWANECDSSIFETYRKNHPNTMLNTTDVRLLKDQDIPSCDGVIGGPPCQAWSEGGKQLGFKDPRGQLFLEYINEEMVMSEHPTRKNHDVYTGSYDAKYMARNRVRSWNEQSFTIQAQARNEPQHPQAPKMTYVSPNMRIFAKGYEHLYRRLSVRECARIQTFPDSFVFIYDDIKDGYKMVGNAVPPRLAYALAVQVRKALL